MPLSSFLEWIPTIGWRTWIMRLITQYIDPPARMSAASPIHGAAFRARADVVRQALENASRDRFHDVLAAVQSCGALDYARHEAEKAAERAVAVLGPLPDSEHKAALVEIARLSVARNA